MAQSCTSVLYVGMRSMPVLLWVAVEGLPAGIMQYCQRIFQLLCGTSCPFLTEERMMERDGEQGSKVDFVRARKVGRMGGRQGGR